MNLHWLWPAAAVASFALTRLTMRLAARRQLLDIPNERSSHDRPVPRGGGIAIAVTFMAGTTFAWIYGVADARFVYTVLGGGGLVGLVGVADDYRDIPAGWRLALQMLVAGWALYWLNGIPGQLLPGVPPVFVNTLGVLCIVWLINLYNFMDGIDAIAGVETMTVCVGSIVIYVYVAHDDAAWIPPAVLAACVSGFLYWNYPPARIFLGDVGSGFLGFMMAVLSIQAGHLQPEFFWAWMILLGVFVVDAGMTLARRMLRRQPVHEAHRSHAYQFASRKYGAHAPVSLAVGAINLAWLLPLAVLVASGRAPVGPTLLIAYLPLIGLAFYFKAGAPEMQEKF